MIEVQRRKTISAPASQVMAVLSDLEHIGRLLPRVERVEVQGSTENRARLAISIRAGKLGLQRLDGEARILPNGLRFVAVRPIEVDARWTVQERGETSEITAHLSLEPGGMLGSLGRLLPRRVIADRLATELDASLDALTELVKK